MSNKGTNNSKSKSLLKIHFAVILFGLAGLFGKLILLPAIIIVFGRVLFASLSLWIYAKIIGQSLTLVNKRDLWFFVGMGILLAVHWISFFYSIQISTVAIGLLTYATFPIFTALLEPLFFKEKHRFQDILWAGVAFIGVALVIPDLNFENKVTQGAFWGVISGVTFAILSIVNKRFTDHYSGLSIALFQDVVATIILLPLVFLYPASWILKDVLLLVLLGVVFTGISHSMFISGLKNIKAHTASIIASLEPVYGILAAILVLKEYPDWQMILGGMIILFASFWVTGYSMRN